MSSPTRIAAFVAGLLLIFGAAVAVGSAVEPADTETGGHEEEKMSEMNGHGGHGETSEVPAGLAVAEGGYELRLEPTDLERGESGRLSLEIVDSGGDAVTEFDELHERRLHLIVVRRDGSDFRHLHPEMDAAGTWTVPVEFGAAGVYRAFADFSVGGEQQTLASDLLVSGGDFEAGPFPAPEPSDSTDGYEVALASGEPRAGEATELTFSVERDGAPVDDLAPYLGAKGHLVALREGDLAFLHVHPEEAADGHGHGTEGEQEHGGADEIAFAATFPSPGRYRLYLQFRHAGAVHTAEFTVEVPR